MSTVTREYELPAVTQPAYLDLFERIAHDFGTRSTRDRRRVSRYSDASLQTLLNEPVSSDILYGYGDPGALHVPAAGGEQTYCVAVTSNDAPQAFPILQSHDLRAWRLAGFVFPSGATPPWAAEPSSGGEYWAPELHAVDGRFVVCFAAREHDGTFAIGLAYGASPLGPFTPADAPLVRGGVIDPNIFVDDDGSALLCWKQDDNEAWPGLICTLVRERPDMIDRLFTDAADAKTAALNAVLWPWTLTLAPMERFFVQQVLIGAVVANFATVRAALEQQLSAPNETAFAELLRSSLAAMRTPIYAQALDVHGGTLLGEPHAILTNDAEWEAHLVEGPWLTKQQGRYYLFYAGNDFSTAEYGVGVAVATAPFGPYAKMDRPLVQSTRAWWGPGHPSVAAGPDGRPWMFLHAYRPQGLGYKQFRALLATPLTFGDETVSIASP